MAFGNAGRGEQAGAESPCLSKSEMRVVNSVLLYLFVQIYANFNVIRKTDTGKRDSVIILFSSTLQERSRVC